MTLLILLLLAIAPFLTSCRTGRLGDLAECGKLSVGVGVGLEIYGSLGSFCQPALGLPWSSSHTFRVGTESRDAFGYWIDDNHCWPLIFNIDNKSQWRSTYRRNDDYADGPRTEGKVISSRYWFPPFQRGKRWSSLSPKKISDFEIGTTLGVVSMRVGINPIEVIDFILGFVGLDICSDDPDD